MSARARVIRPSDDPLESPEERDRAWFAQIRDGKVPAFEALFRAYFTGLWRFAYRYVRDRQTAEDIVQDVLARVWEQRETLTPSGTMRTYLFRAVRNRTIDLHKHDLVERRVLVRDMSREASLEVTDSAVLPDERVLRSEVRRFVDELPEPRRTAVVLRYYEGLSFAEIAEILEVSVKAAEMLVARAVRVLQRQIIGRGR